MLYLQEERLMVERLRDHLPEAVTARGCRLVLVDHLDLFAGPDGRATEHEHVSAISKALKQMAKDLRIVVLCLVQPSRKLESRVGVQGKRPQERRAADERADARWTQIWCSTSIGPVSMSQG